MSLSRSGSGDDRSPVRTAVISGAGGGIGRALAVRLAGDGWSVGLVDVDGEAVEATARLVSAAASASPASGVAVAPVVRVVDVGDWQAVAGFAVDVRERFGRVDAVFCAAGVIHTGDVCSTDPGDFEHVWRVNVLGSFHAAKAFLPDLIGSRGRLVFLSSAFGLMAAPNYSAYCASKFAVRGLAESLRQEMAMAGHDVTVSCAYPGGVRTGIMRRGRYAAGVDRAAVMERFDARIARTSPDEAAAAILAGVRAGRHRILVGRDARLVSGVVRVVGGAYPGLMEKLLRLRRQ